MRYILLNKQEAESQYNLKNDSPSAQYVIITLNKDKTVNIISWCYDEHIAKKLLDKINNRYESDKAQLTEMFEKYLPIKLEKTKEQIEEEKKKQKEYMKEYRKQAKLKPTNFIIPEIKTKW